MSCPACGRESSASGLCPQCRSAFTQSDIAGAATFIPGGSAFESDQAATILPASLRTGFAGIATAADIDAPTELGTARLTATSGDESSSARPATSVESGPLEIGQAFGPRYHIIRLLGAGGMGAVYHAWDAELGVSVAIKVIRPEIMADPRTGAEVERRFKRELLLARQVTHKNVVRIHDLGEISDIKYITMPYVDGVDLATRLKKDGKLPVAEALRIARPVVSGLVAAHSAGVVHRDLKPANIMMGPDGDALIMDFGIASSSGAPMAGAEVEALPAHLRRMAARSSAMTQAHGISGTVEYMAPEQARAESVDQRADIYAFGLILYDLLLGRRRSKEAKSALAELQSRMEHAPPSLRSILPEIPEALDNLISRCLEPDPANRFQSTSELEAELNRLDEQGDLIPVKRVVGMRMLAVVVTLALVLLAGTWWYARTLVPPPPRDPVTVVIADLDNLTHDPAFDGTLEPMLKRALEGAGFISAYDRSAVARTLGVRPPEKLDEVAARELAVKQGLGIVVSGSLSPQGRGYAVSIKAAQTVTGEVIATANGRASDRDEILGVATRLMGDIREALGDDTSDSAQMFAMTNLSATSLDVVRHYAAAQDAASNGKFDQVVQSASKAVEIDPKFGIGYQLLAVASRNLGRLQDADRYINEALRHLDGMTERERLTTRGMFYRVTGDYQQCVKEYGELIARYAADVVGHNQLALCSSQLRDMRRAVDEMQQVVKLLPNRTLFRDNLALYANYASDFQAAEKEARAIKEPDVFSALALAFAQSGQGQLALAKETYQGIATTNALGASLAVSGLGDLALHEGRYSDAVQVLTQGAAADLASKNPDRAAAKFALLSHTQTLRGQNAAAVAAAEQALANSNAVKIRFLAARSFVEANEIARARPLIAGLASELQSEPQAYAKIVEGQIALKGGDARLAIKVLLEANGILDTWIGSFDLGRAYLAAGALPQADSQFDRCLKRRGEALSLFLDEEPTSAYFPPVYYYQGRVREEMQNGSSAESYRAYLALRGESKEDPFVRDIRRRLAP